MVVTLNNGKKIVEELDRADAHPYGARPFKRQNYINKLLIITQGNIDKNQSRKGRERFSLCNDFQLF